MKFTDYLSLLLERNFDIHNTVKKVPTTLHKQLELCLSGHSSIYKDPKYWFYSFVNLPTLQTNFTKYTSDRPFGTPLGIFSYPVVYTENAINLKTWPFAAKTKYCAMFKISEQAYNQTYNAEGGDYKALDETVYKNKVFGSNNSIFSIIKNKYAKKISKHNLEYTYNEIEQTIQDVSTKINKEWSELIYKNLLSHFNKSEKYSYNEIYRKLVEDELPSVKKTLEQQNVKFDETKFITEFSKATDNNQKNASDDDIIHFIKEQEKNVEKKLEKLHLDDNYLSKFYILIYHLFYYDTTAQKDSAGIEQGKRCLNLPDSASHNEALITQIFKDCNVFGIVDNGDGLIHPHEKCQGMFLEKTKIDAETKTKYIEKVLIWENDLFDKKYKEDYNDEDLEESRYVYDKIKEIYGSKITNFGFVKNSKNMQLPWNDDYLDNSGAYYGDLEQDKEKNDEENKKIKYIDINSKYLVTDEYIKFLQFEKMTATGVTFINCKFIQKDKLSFTDCTFNNCEITSKTTGTTGSFTNCTFKNSSLSSRYEYKNNYTFSGCKFSGTFKDKWFDKENAVSPVHDIENGTFDNCTFNNPYKMMVLDTMKYTNCTIAKYKLFCVALHLSHSFTKDILHKKLDFINNFKFNKSIRIKFMFDEKNFVFLDVDNYTKTKEKLYSDEFYNLLSNNHKNLNQLTSLLDNFMK